MTPKLLAKPPTVFRYPKHAGSLVTSCGRTFVWGFLHLDWMQSIKVGDRVWVAHRLNKPTYDWCYELYQIIIPEKHLGADPGNRYRPKLWLGRQRDIIFEL